MLHITPQLLAPLDLSKLDTRLLKQLDRAQTQIDRIDELLARINESIAEFGVAPERLMERIEVAISRAEGIITRVEERASDALAAEVADIRQAFEAGADLVETVKGVLPEELLVSQEDLAEIRKASKQLERIEERALDRLDALIDRAEDTGTDALYNKVDARLAQLGERVDAIDETLNALFDPRLETLREELDRRATEVDAIRNPAAEPDPIPDPEPEPEPEPAPAPEYVAADFQGDGETVVVIDTGWNTQFIGDYETISFDYDFYGADDDNARVSHQNDHGSWVDQVVRGVANMADVIHMKVFPDGGGSASFFDIGQALNWAIEHVQTYNITSVNLSLGAGNVQDYVSNHYFSDEYQTLADLGVLTVVAAGNSGEYGMNYIAADPNAIAVSASTANDSRASFSQHHEDLTDIFAFGHRVDIKDEFGGTDRVSGTSFSAPYVAGIAARVQEAAEEIIDRHLTQEEFVFVLQESGTDLAGYSGDADGYRVADADLAVEYFIDNYADFV